MTFFILSLISNYSNILHAFVSLLSLFSFIPCFSNHVKLCTSKKNYFNKNVTVLPQELYANPLREQRKEICIKQSIDMLYEMVVEEYKKNGYALSTELDYLATHVKKITVLHNTFAITNSISKCYSKMDLYRNMLSILLFNSNAAQSYKQSVKNGNTNLNIQSLINTSLIALNIGTAFFNTYRHAVLQDIRLHSPNMFLDTLATYTPVYVSTLIQLPSVFHMFEYLRVYPANTDMELLKTYSFNRARNSTSIFRQLAYISFFKILLYLIGLLLVIMLGAVAWAHFSFSAPHIGYAKGLDFFTPAINKLVTWANNGNAGIPSQFGQKCTGIIVFLTFFSPIFFGLILIFVLSKFTYIVVILYSVLKHYTLFITAVTILFVGLSVFAISNMYVEEYGYDNYYFELALRVIAKLCYMTPFIMFFETLFTVLSYCFTFSLVIYYYVVAFITEYLLRSITNKRDVAKLSEQFKINELRQIASKLRASSKFKQIKTILDDVCLEHGLYTLCDEYESQDISEEMLLRILSDSNQIAAIMKKSYIPKFKNLKQIYVLDPLKGALYVDKKNLNLVFNNYISEKKLIADIYDRTVINESIFKVVAFKSFLSLFAFSLYKLMYDARLIFVNIDWSSPYGIFVSTTLISAVLYGNIFYKNAFESNDISYINLSLIGINLYAALMFPASILRNINDNIAVFDCMFKGLVVFSLLVTLFKYYISLGYLPGMNPFGGSVNLIMMPYLRNVLAAFKFYYALNRHNRATKSELIAEHSRRSLEPDTILYSYDNTKGNTNPSSSADEFKEAQFMALKSTAPIGGASIASGFIDAYNDFLNAAETSQLGEVLNTYNDYKEFNKTSAPDGTPIVSLSASDDQVMGVSRRSNLNVPHSPLAIAIGLNLPQADRYRPASEFNFRDMVKKEMKIIHNYCLFANKDLVDQRFEAIAAEQAAAAAQAAGTAQATTGQRDKNYAQIVESNLAKWHFKAYSAEDILYSSTGPATDDVLTTYGAIVVSAMTETLHKTTLALRAHKAHLSAEVATSLTSDAIAAAQPAAGGAAAAAAAPPNVLNPGANAAPQTPAWTLGMATLMDERFPALDVVRGARSSKSYELLAQKLSSQAISVLQPRQNVTQKYKQARSMYADAAQCIAAGREIAIASVEPRMMLSPIAGPLKNLTDDQIVEACLKVAYDPAAHKLFAASTGGNLQVRNPADGINRVAFKDDNNKLKSSSLATTSTVRVPDPRACLEVRCLPSLNKATMVEHNFVHDYLEPNPSKIDKTFESGKLLSSEVEFSANFENMSHKVLATNASAAAELLRGQERVAFDNSQGVKHLSPDFNARKSEEIELRQNMRTTGINENIANHLTEERSRIRYYANHRHSHLNTYFDDVKCRQRDEMHLDYITDSQLQKDSGLYHTRGLLNLSLMQRDSIIIAEILRIVLLVAFVVYLNSIYTIKSIVIPYVSVIAVIKSYVLISQIKLVTYYPNIKNIIRDVLKSFYSIVQIYIYRESSIISYVRAVVIFLLFTTFGELISADNHSIKIGDLVISLDLIRSICLLFVFSVIIGGLHMSELKTQIEPYDNYCNINNLLYFFGLMAVVNSLFVKMTGFDMFPAFFITCINVVMILLMSIGVISLAILIILAILTLLNTALAKKTDKSFFKDILNDLDHSFTFTPILEYANPSLSGNEKIILSLA